MHLFLGLILLLQVFETEFKNLYFSFDHVTISRNSLMRDAKKPDDFFKKMKHIYGKENYQRFFALKEALLV